MLLTPVSSTNQSNAHLIAEKLSKVVLSTHYTMQLSLLASKKEKFEDTIKVILPTIPLNMSPVEQEQPTLH
jgi:hypothetical protein